VVVVSLTVKQDLGAKDYRTNADTNAENLPLSPNERLLSYSVIY
jgi:hypothetical protein